MSSLQVDRDWAWAQFEPSDDSPWDLAAAAHLFRRAGFGATMSELQDAVKKSARKVVESLVCAKEPEAFLLQMDRLVRAALATGNVKQLSAQWAYRMLHTPAPLRAP